MTHINHTPLFLPAIVIAVMALAARQLETDMNSSSRFKKTICRSRSPGDALRNWLFVFPLAREFLRFPRSESAFSTISRVITACSALSFILYQI